MFNNNIVRYCNLIKGCINNSKYKALACKITECIRVYVFN